MKPPVYNPEWSEEVKRLYEHDMQEIWDSSIAPHIYVQYNYLLDFYFSLIEGERTLEVLDVGCAQATLALLMAEKGHRVTALDIRPEFLEYAKSRHTDGNIDFVAGNLFEEKLINSDFDIVFANQIIEHVLEPQQKIERLAEHIKPGGRLVMTTPNYGYVRSTLPSYQQFISQGVHFEENSADADGHVFAFMLDELTRQIELAGLRIEDAGWLETPLVNGHMKFRYFMSVLPKSLGRFLDSLILGCPGLNRRLAHQIYVVARK